MISARLTRTSLLARGGAAAAACALLSLGLAAPARAQTWDRDDRAGDGPVGGDIRHLTVANKTATVRVVVGLARLMPKKTGSDFFVIDTERADGYDYLLYTHWTKAGVKRHLIRAVPFSDSDAHSIACPDLKVNWRTATDRIVAVIPQSCLRRPTPYVRAGFYSIDKGSTDDDWVPGQYATFGPWLNVG
jgi:cyclophilin family peptidyl-prolyl cis-trans isomerase